MFSFFKKGKETQLTPPISEKYEKLRSLIIGLSPDSQGIKPSDELPNVWGILIEASSKFPKLTIAIKVLADGSTSIFASEGAAYIGIGAHAEIAEVSKFILTASEKLFQGMKPTMDFPIPTFGKVNFYIFTYSGAFMESVDEKELYKGTHSLSSLYAAYHDVLHRNPALAQNNPSK